MQYLSVYRGQKLVINVSFSCAHENHVSLRDFATGAELFNANSHMNNNRHWESPVNTSPEPRLYSLLAFHKNTPPDGHEPWYPSAERVVFAGPFSRIIGYEDSTDGDFNDAVASVLWTIGN